MLDGMIFQGRRVSLTAHEQSCLQRPSVSASSLEQDIIISQAVKLSATVGGNQGTRSCSGKCLSFRNCSEMCVKRGTKGTEKKYQVYIIKKREQRLMQCLNHTVIKSNQK